MEPYVAQVATHENGKEEVTLPDELTVKAVVQLLQVPEHEVYAAAANGALQGRREFANRYGRWFFSSNAVVAWGKARQLAWENAFTYIPTNAAEAIDPTYGEMLTIRQIVREFPVKEGTIYAAISEPDRIAGSRMIKHVWYAPRGSVSLWYENEILGTGELRSHYPVAQSDEPGQTDMVQCHFCQEWMPATGKGQHFKVYTFRLNVGTVEEPRYEVHYLPAHPACLPGSRAVRAQRDHARAEAQGAYHQLEALREQYIALSQQTGQMNDTIERLKDRLEDVPILEKKLHESLTDAEAAHNTLRALEQDHRRTKELLAQAQASDSHQRLQKVEEQYRELQARFIELRADYEATKAQRDNAVWERDSRGEQLRQQQVQLDTVSAELGEALAVLSDTQAVRDRLKGQVTAMKSAMQVFMSEG